MASTTDATKFWKLVDIIKKVHSNAEDPEEGDMEYKHLLPLGNIYGRVTSHPCDAGDCGPLKLSESVGRETVFLFGSDALEATILECNTFDTLVELGLTKEMIIKKVKERKDSFWLILFQLPSNYCDAAACREIRQFVGLHQATWDGVVDLVKLFYPLAAPDMEQHLDKLQNTPFEEFERAAGFRFIDTHHSTTSSGPPPYKYTEYCALPKPRKAWQTRLFLYCELHLLELYTGDGRTHCKGLSVRHKEYLCRDVTLQGLREHGVPCEAISLTVVLPEQNLSS